MDLATVIQAVTAVAGFLTEEVPKLTELVGVLNTGDQAQLDAFLAKLQAENDVLGKA